MRNAALSVLALVLLTALSQQGAEGASQRVLRSSSVHSKDSKRESQYKATQLVAFSINTFPVSFTSINLPDPSKFAYLGDNDTSVDMATRVEILRTALDELKDADWIGKDMPEVLKVFLVPEFFFRGPTGAYNATDMMLDDAAFPLGSALWNLTRGEEWEDWLFVFGTIIAQASPPAGSKEALNINNTLYYNVAPIFKGNSDIKLLAQKNYISSIDFLSARPDDGYVENPYDLNIYKYGAIPPSFLKMLNMSGFQVVQDNKFTVDGLKVGIEICLDHAYGSLAKALPKGKYVDLHLIVSAGMTITRGPAGTAKGYPIYLVDGQSRSESTVNKYGLGQKARYDGTFDMGPVRYTTPTTTLFQKFLSLFGAPSGFEVNGAMEHNAVFNTKEDLDVVGKFYDLGSYRDVYDSLVNLTNKDSIDALIASGDVALGPAVDIYLPVPQGVWDPEVKAQIVSQLYEIVLDPSTTDGLKRRISELLEQLEDDPTADDKNSSAKSARSARKLAAREEKMRRRAMRMGLV